MSWKYGIVKTKLDDGSDWYYLAEVYEGMGHTTMDSYGAISGGTEDEVIEQIEIILSDLKNNLVTVVETKDDE